MKHAAQWRNLWVGTALLLSLLGLRAIAAAEARVISEYEVKAAFLHKFALFVEWPGSAFQKESDPFVIGILGQDPFGPHLAKAIAGKLVGNRPILLRTYRTVAEAKDCHLLYISPSERPNLRQIMSELGGRGVLTVGDMAGFAEQGGVINFVRSGQTIKFHINPDAAKRAGLTISSQVLEMAVIVRDAAPPPP